MDLPQDLEVNSQNTFDDEESTSLKRPLGFESRCGVEISATPEEEDDDNNDQGSGESAEGEGEVVEVGEKTFDGEGALCGLAEKGGVTMKGHISMGGQMQITHNNYQDQRTTTKHTHHHHGPVTQQYEGNTIHHHGDHHHSHYTDTEAGYTQIKDQSELAMQSDQSVFVETWAFRAALDKLSETGLLLLCGPPASGKSCLAHALMRHYSAQGLTPLLLHSFEEWRAHVGGRGDRRHTIVLEDVFGKDQLETGSLAVWERSVPAVRQLTSSGQSVVIITATQAVADALSALQLHQHQHASCALLLSRHALTLSSSDLAARLSQDEKRRILETHLKQAKKSISPEVFEEVLVQLSATKNADALFPGQCKLFAESALENKEALRQLTLSATQADGVSICGSGPNVFIKIAPDIVKKSLRHPTKKLGRWNVAFTNTRGDIEKHFDEELWTTANIQRMEDGSSGVGRKSADHGEKEAELSPKEEGSVQGEGDTDSAKEKQVCDITDTDADTQSCDVTDKDTDTRACDVSDSDTDTLACDVTDTDTDTRACDVTDTNTDTRACDVSATDTDTEVFDVTLTDADTVISRFDAACRAGDSAAMLKLVWWLQGNAVLPGKDGFTALHAAVWAGQAEVVDRRLLNTQCDVNAVDSQGWSALHVACLNGAHTHIVRRLVARGADVELNTLRGLRPLHVACRYGHLDTVEFLLNEGADMDSPASTGWRVSPLHVAAYYGYRDVTELLLRLQARRDVAEISGWQPLHYASQQGHLDVVKVLLSPPPAPVHLPARPLELSISCPHGHTRLVRNLLECGVGTHDARGKTSVCRACYLSHKPALENLSRHDLFPCRPAHRDVTALFLASQKGHQDVVRALLEAGACTEVRVFDWTAVHVAAYKGHADVIQHLLQHGADITDPVDNVLWTPLHLAAANGHSRAVDVLLQNGADPKDKDNHGLSPLGRALVYGQCGALDSLLSRVRHMYNDRETATKLLAVACSGGSVEAIAALRNWIPDLFDLTRDSDTLHVACKESSAEMVETLIQGGFAVNRQDGKGRTPLHVASEKGKDVIAETLISHGARVDEKDSQGDTPLHVACNGYETAVARVLLEKGRANTEVTTENQETALLLAASRRCPELVNLLVEHGAHVNVQDESGRTPLMCGRVCTEIVETLLEHEADPSIKSQDGDTVLYETCLYSVEHIIEVLIRHGVDLEMRGPAGETALMTACRGKGQKGVMVRLLLEGGAMTEACDELGLTALQLACRLGDAEVVEQLLHHGARADRQDKLGESPLHQACRHGLAQLIQPLQRAGADLDQRDLEGNTPLHTSCSHLQPSCVTALLSLGADPGARNSAGHTALDLVSSVMTAAQDKGCKDEDAQPLKAQKRTEIMVAFMQCRQHVPGPPCAAVAQSAECSGSEREASQAGDSVLPEKERHGDNEHTSAATLTEAGGEVAVTVADGEATQARAQRDRQAVADTRASGWQDARSAVNGSTTSGSPRRTVPSVEVDNPHREEATNADISPATQTATPTDTYIPSVIHSSPDTQQDSGGHAESVTRTTYHVAPEEQGVYSVDNGHSSQQVTAKEMELPPLHQACVEGRVDAVLHHLLTCSDVNALSGGQSGQSALHCACSGGQHDTAALLLQYGADPSLRDAQGRTPLHAAARRGHLSVVDLLLTRQATDVWATDQQGRTPLHEASSQGHACVSSLLLLHGALVDAADTAGDTPLILGCGSTRACDVCVVLLNWGADPRRTNRQGRRAGDVVVADRQLRSVLLRTRTASCSLPLPTLNTHQRRADPRAWLGLALGPLCVVLAVLAAVLALLLAAFLIP